MTEILQAIHEHYRELGYCGLRNGHFSDQKGGHTPYLVIPASTSTIRLAHANPTIITVTITHKRGHSRSTHLVEYQELDLNDPHSLDRLFILLN